MPILPAKGPSTGLRHTPIRRHPSAGLTLIELVVTLAVVSILLGVAAPSFVSMSKSNRVSVEVNSFVSDLQYARSEAVKRGLPVTLCASSSGTSCLGSSSWHAGWIVFPDPTASGVVAAGETPLRSRAAFVSGDTFVATPGVAALTYSRDGFALNLPAGGTTLILHTSPLNSAATRCLAITLVGRHAVQSAGTGSCI
jgi:type IV fimbrial biogenesis protein FimT